MCRLAICASRTSTIVLSRTGFVDAGSEHALHQAYLLLPPAVCPAGFIGQNKSQEAVPRALHWDHLTSTVTSTETSWHPDKSSSLFDVPFSGLGSTERARMLIKFFLIAQRPSRASEKSLRYWREQTAGQVRMTMHLGEQDSNCESLVVSQNFVLCQDGLTPCHLMLSLSGLTGISRPSGSAHIWGVLNACFTSASGWPGIALSSGSAHRMKNCWSMRGCDLPDPHHRQLHCKKVV
ncbi:uncharacterized protein [Dermacentor andersoni]|uniref:uncharacterized protein isoform X4 n=1 Tax=Dermacentor andersoni TaxID=34620 RepID=UPI0024160E25|nr:uncharacterized protein LOC126520319 isoform X4 [Dermacentor andersoni]XP_054923208.1 uncharacterized protein LOC126524295 isoform X2 [Dermacentor andersoni]